MKKLNHFSLSFSISFWIFYFLFEQNIIITFFLSLFVALLSSLPDIDIKIIRSLNNLNKKTLYLTYPIILVFKLIFKHRTITHTIWLPAILLIFDIYTNFNFFIEYILKILYIAIFLHLIEDSLTISGIKPLYPIPLKIKLFNFSTDSKIHFLFFQSLSYVILFSFFFFIIF
jgi:hypothetical protein